MDYPCVPQPQALRKSLFYHQLTSIYQMESRETHTELWVDDTTYIKTRVGILADLAGYGKTLSMLGLIARTLDKPFEGGDEFKKIETGSQLCQRVRLVSVTRVPGTLVITNPSLIAQWESELRQTTLPYVVVQSKRDMEGLSGDGVILCPSNLLHNLVVVFSNTQFRRIVIDEPVTLKISGMGTVSAAFTWLVTATPYDLIGKSRPKYLMDILPDDFDMVGLIMIKNPDNFVRSSFCMPPTNHEYLETTDLCPKVLRGIIPDHMYAVLESGNVGRFLSHYGIKREGHRHFLNLIEDKLRQDEDGRLHVLRERLLNVAKLECFVCSDRVQDPAVTACCNQVGCSSCLVAWMELSKPSACPMCRTPMEAKDLTSLEVEVSPSVQSIKPRSKLSILEGILGGVMASRKVLVYAHYEKSGKQLQSFLGSRYQWADLRGTRGQKERVLEEYREGDLSILLLTCVVDSAGFNLQNTTDVVLFDKPSEYVEAQVIGRALRVGRTAELKVWHIV